MHLRTSEEEDKDAKKQASPGQTAKAGYERKSFQNGPQLDGYAESSKCLPEIFLHDRQTTLLEAQTLVSIFRVAVTNETIR